ncbi:MAG: tRNA (guanosine(46)-N7)-methyltransferase TrmB [Bacilli bacterium]|nr:tRNA (guanosine(46)-N7)-methyltransferase TrmB [Bacilli bacterium]
MRTKYKPWAKPYIDEHPELMYPIEDVKKLSNLHLEIGCGKGAFIIKMAKKHPDIFYLAVEKNVSCVGSVAKGLVEEKIENVKLMLIDGEKVLDELDDNSVKVLFLNFSDPWPKKRHYKRRLTYEGFINKYVRVLEMNGEIRFKTDNDDLYEFSKESFLNSSLKIVSDIYDYDGLDLEDESTEYEIKKRNSGLKIHRLILRKE